MSEPIQYPRISVEGPSPACEQLLTEWNEQTYQDPQLAAMVLRKMIETPQDSYLDNEPAVHFRDLTGSLLEASDDGKQLEFPSIDDDEVFETQRHQDILKDLQKARRNGDKDGLQQALRRLSLDLLSHQVEVVETYRTDLSA